jgi:hypothetical protein
MPLWSGRSRRIIGQAGSWQVFNLVGVRCR